MVDKMDRINTQKSNAGSGLYEGPFEDPLWQEAFDASADFFLNADFLESEWEKFGLKDAFMHGWLLASRKHVENDNEGRDT